MKKRQRQKDQLLAQVRINNKDYSVRASAHAIQRMQERKVDSYIVTGNILSLGEERILKLQEKGEEAILIDENTNTSIVFGFKGNRIQVITVIDKANVFVKRGTLVVNL